MSDTDSGPNEILHYYQEFWRSPQSLMPNAAFARQMSDAAQTVMAAQLSYAQAAMCMNAKLMGFWLNTTEDASPVHVAEDEKARERRAA